MEKYHTIDEALGEIWTAWSGPAAKPPDIIGLPRPVTGHTDVKTPHVS